MIQLVVKDTSNVIDFKFGAWLTQQIKTKLIGSIKKYNFTIWDKYLNESPDIIRLYKKKYNTSDIIIFAANNLVCKAVPGELIIQFNTAKFVNGFDRLDLNTIIKMINYGTLDIKGCPIFTDVLHQIEDDIVTLFRLYYGF